MTTRITAAGRVRRRDLADAAAGLPSPEPCYAEIGSSPPDFPAITSTAPRTRREVEQ